MYYSHIIQSYYVVHGVTLHLRMVLNFSHYLLKVTS